jgi:hypothetical protein
MAARVNVAKLLLEEGDAKRHLFIMLRCKSAILIHRHGFISIQVNPLRD